MLLDDLRTAMMTADADHLLDVRGLRCPLPVLKTRKLMRGLGAGARVRVLSTDPLAALDIPNYCREDGLTLVESRRDGDTLAFLIAKP